MCQPRDFDYNMFKHTTLKGDHIRITYIWRMMSLKSNHIASSIIEYYVTSRSDVTWRLKRKSTIHLVKSIKTLYFHCNDFSN